MQTLFLHNNKVLCEYNGPQPSEEEMAETRALLAYEKGIDVKDILTVLNPDHFVGNFKNVDTGKKVAVYADENGLLTT